MSNGKFQRWKNTRFQTLTSIVNELNKWSEVTDNECEHSLNTYLAKLNSTPLNPTGLGNKSRNITQPSKTSLPSSNSHKQQHSNEYDEPLLQDEVDEEEDESVHGRK